MKVMADVKAAPSPAWAERRALGARIVEVVALGDALSGEKLACLRKFDELRGWADEGAVSCAHWLSSRTGLSRGAAREQVRVARALGRLPLIEAESVSGTLRASVTFVTEALPHRTGRYARPPVAPSARGPPAAEDE